MDIKVPKNFIENRCTVEQTVLIINFDNSDDPDSKKEDSASERSPTPVEENDSEEESNKKTNSEANKVADKPQFQQQRKDCASASVSKQCDTQKYTKDAPSMKSGRKQDSSESGIEILYNSEDEAELDRVLMEVDVACKLVDQAKEEVNLPRHHSNDLTLEEIEEEILKIELACSRKEACTSKQNTEPDLIHFHKYLTKHRPDMTLVARVSADVQNLISTETESHDEDSDLTDRNYGRHVSFHSLEPESGRVNPIPRHYYTEDSEHQEESEGNVKQDIPPRRDYRGLHRPEPVSATDHVITHLRNIHERDELRIDSLTTEAIQRPTNQIDDPENSTNQFDVDDIMEDRAQAAHYVSAHEANRPEQQDNKTGNKKDPSPEE